ncbi:dipeptidase [Nocardia africana]|uniref:Dipeptidase n=1 Tax=Nocardia africana TaxID=134964 RepID=A0ABW6NCG6_9NOCA
MNVGYAPHNTADSTALIDHYTTELQSAGIFDLAGSIADIEESAANGRVAVAFDLEDAAPLEGKLDRVAEFYDRGVRTLLPTYNYQNDAGSGCMDSIDEGLSAYGRDLVREMNVVGMTVDASHCSPMSGLEMCRLSATPVIYSHTGLGSVYQCDRNITDDQARACAETGGVVGILGMGIFLGENDSSISAVLRHLEYALDLLGPDHVGLGSDYTFDLDDAIEELTAHPENFPSWFTEYGAPKQVELNEFLSIGQVLRSRGYDNEIIDKILGGNFKRVANLTWR